MNFEIVNAVLSFSGLIIITMSFILCLPRKYPLPVIIGSFIAYTAVILVINHFTGHMDKLPLPNGWPYIPLVIILFRGHVYQKLFLLFSSLFLSLAMMLFFSMLFGFFVPYGSVKIFVMMITSVSAFSIAYIILASRYSKLFMKRFFAGGNRKEWALYMITAIVGYTFLFILRRVHVQNNFIHFGALIFLMWSFFILCFAIINTHEKSQKSHEADFAQSVISSGHDHYRKMNEMYDALAILRHDYKYHLKAISELVKKRDIDEIERYLSDVQAGQTDTDLRHYCGNSVINALLGSYAERCAKQSIRYDVQLTMPQTLSITNYDMCIILGNLLENAVEACQKMTGSDFGTGEPEHRKITVTARTQGSLLAVKVVNSFSGRIVTENGLPLSTKKNGSGHGYRQGYGLRSVYAVAGRYDGNVLTEWDNETFTACVMVGNVR